MTKTLTELLLRLSEAGEPALLPGRLASKHFGRTFDGLLNVGVLEELAPVDEWPVCPNCDCDADAWQVQERDGGVVAACRQDYRRDARLDPEDLRRFRINGNQLVGLLAEDFGGHAEVLPGLSRFWTDKGRCGLFLTLRRRVVEDPALIAVLRQSEPGQPAVLVCPEPSGEAQLRLEQAGVRLCLVKELLTLSPSGQLKLSGLSFEGRVPGPKLTVYKADNSVLLNGRRSSIPANPFRLLMLMVEAGSAGLSPDEIQAAFSGRDPVDLVRDLRDALGRDDTLIVTLRNPTRYRMNLEADEIEIVSVDA